MPRCAICGRLVREFAPVVHRECLETETASKWVSVKDRLPGEAGTYLVATRNRAVKITHFYLLQQIFSSKRINRLVTHWMPLPEPPKEEEHE